MLHPTDSVRPYPLIVLCGGESSRMGCPKGLLPFRGRPWLFHQLSRFRRAGGGHVVVVLGAQAESYFEAVPILSTALAGSVSRKDLADGLRISVTVNRHWQHGPFSSLVSALECLDRPVGQRGEIQTFPAAFVLPIDVPAADPETWQSLAAEFRFDRMAITPRYRLRGGHPVLLNQCFLNMLKQIPLGDDDARLDLQLNKLYDNEIKRVVVSDPLVARNLNTPSDWDAFCQTF